MHPDSPAHEWINQQRWLNDPGLSHELYNLGHLYEAAVAHYQATGKCTLLEVALKSAGLLWHDFGSGELRIAPGHEVVEMGLVKLCRATGDRRYLQLAQIFLDARGPGGPEYNQRHLRVVDQTTAVGHAVRANYLYAGMADVAALTGEQRYVAAISRISDNVMAKKLYLIGSVGARADGEAYGNDYELPNDGYNETCAAIALMMWNHRMFLLTGDARYIDVLERSCFNGVISGVSLGGDRFFYTNPCVYDGAKKNNSGFAGRVPWFGCACCPPNLMRTLAALTGYFYAVRDDSLYVNFFAQSEGRVTVAGMPVETRPVDRLPVGRPGAAHREPAAAEDVHRSRADSRVGAGAAQCRPISTAMTIRGRRPGRCRWPASRRRLWSSMAMLRSRASGIRGMWWRSICR